ncbi:YdcF family protein [Nocardia veterana]|uniref:YdcF family protein n=1 Tax=Nocardia veterana TaxID=132249 RepID=A0A7X6M2W0_9NOCA|nr:YdcF family protein [Nocardia veterana]NKY88739.1 YdcF family protein [Nocardia veterana]
MPDIRTCFCHKSVRLLAAPAIAAAAMVTTWAAAPTAGADVVSDAIGSVVHQVEAATGAALAGLPAPHGPDTAIVVLGYGLLPDGDMRPELVERLQAGLVQAVVSPSSPIIVTGGNPRNGTTEAEAMARWLTDHGVAPERIHIEPRAANTIENAANSEALMKSLGSRDAVVVTSADHMPRAVADFVDAGVPVVGTVSPQSLPPIVMQSFGPRD